MAPLSSVNTFAVPGKLVNLGSQRGLQFGQARDRILVQANTAAASAESTLSGVKTLLANLSNSSSPASGQTQNRAAAPTENQTSPRPA